MQGHGGLRQFSIRDDGEFHQNQPSTKETNKLSNIIKFCQIIIKLLFTLKTVKSYFKNTPGNVANKFTFERINTENI